MKYMLLIYDDEQGWAKLSETQRQQGMEMYMTRVGVSLCLAQR